MKIQHYFLFIIVYDHIFNRLPKNLSAFNMESVCKLIDVYVSSVFFFRLSINDDSVKPLL